MSARNLVRLAVVLLVVAAVLVPAVSAAAGQGPKGKVEVCHVPQGGPGNAHTVSVSRAALPAHLAHGDTLGRCRVERPGNGTSGDRAPIADAGADRCVLFGGAVMLDGRGSSDPDHDVLAFDWDVLLRPAGSSVTDASLQPSDRASTPTYTPDRLGTYRFRLGVRDPDGHTDTDTVDVTARMGVTLDREGYVVDEGETVAVWIGLHAAAPQPVTVAIAGDPTEAVVVRDAHHGTSDAVTSVVIPTGSTGVFVYLLGVEDADILDEHSTITVTVGSGGCVASDAAAVEVGDDDGPSAAAPSVPTRIAARLV